MLGMFAAFRAKIVDNANGKCGHMAVALACSLEVVVVVVVVVVFNILGGCL